MDGKGIGIGIRKSVKAYCDLVFLHLQVKYAEQLLHVHVYSTLIALDVIVDSTLYSVNKVIQVGVTNLHNYYTMYMCIMYQIRK